MKPSTEAIALLAQDMSDVTERGTKSDKDGKVVRLYEYAHFVWLPDVNELDVFAGCLFQLAGQLTWGNFSKKTDRSDENSSCGQLVCLPPRLLNANL